MKNPRRENRVFTHKPELKSKLKNLNPLTPLNKNSNIKFDSPELKIPKNKKLSQNEEQINILKPSNSDKKLSSNLNQEVKERNKNIRVYIRFRPFNIIENELLSTGVGWETPEYNDNEVVTIKTKNDNNNGPSFKFDKVFKSDTPQIEIYNNVGKEIIKDIIDGYNGTIFAYGQSGSGKTFTMYGNDIEDEDNKGLIPRIVNDIFEYVETCDENVHFKFKLSVLQIYKEIIYDLLTGEKNLQIKENTIRGIYVDGLSEVYLSSVDDFLNYAELAEKNRKVGETRLNQQSSRSHSIMILEVTQKLKKENLVKKGILNLVDLAGSEKVSKTGAVGETLEEAKKINLSLSALGNVIHALTSNNEYIPYRDSKLTRILQESLGGNYKTSLIVACSPHSYNLEETITSLQFAQRAKTIKNKAKINIKYSYQELQQMVDKLKKKLEIANLKISQLKNGEKIELEGNYDNCPNCLNWKEEKKNLEEKIEDLMNEIKEKNDKIIELEEKDDSEDDNGIKDKIYKLYKQIKKQLDDIKENNSNLENDKIKDNIIIQNENFDKLISNYMKNSNKNEFFDGINSLMKRSFDIKNEKRYEKIYDEYKKNLNEIFENKIYKENDILEIDKLNLFSIGYFYEYLHYYFSYQLLNDSYMKIKIDNHTLLNMTKSLLSLVDNILSSNYEMANDNTINANALNFLKTTIFDNKNKNFSQTQENLSNQLNLPKLSHRMSVTFGNELQKNLVKIVTKKNMNIMKSTGKRCSMIITEAPIQQNINSNLTSSFRRTSVSIPLIFPKNFNALNYSNNNEVLSSGRRNVQTINSNNVIIENNEEDDKEKKNDVQKIDDNKSNNSQISETDFNKIKKMFTKTEKKQSKLNMIKDLLIVNVTKTEELKKFFKEQKDDFDKIIKLNKDYFTNLILKKDSENINSFEKEYGLSIKEINNFKEKIMNIDSSEDKKSNKKDSSFLNDINIYNNNNTTENNDSKLNTIGSKIKNYENNEENKNKNNNEDDSFYKENNDSNNLINSKNLKIKTQKNNFLKSNSKTENKNININDLYCTNKNGHMFKLKSNLNNEILKTENNLEKRKSINKENSINLIYSRNNTDKNIQRKLSNNNKLSRNNSMNKNKKISKKNLKLEDEENSIIINQPTRNKNLHYKSESVNDSNKKIFDNKRRAFSLENYIEKYLESGTVTRRFNGIKINYNHGKVVCEYDSGLNSNDFINVKKLQNLRLMESKGDDDSVKSSLVTD